MENPSILSVDEWAVAIGKCLGRTGKFQVLDVNSGLLPYLLPGQVGDHIRLQVTIAFQGEHSQRHILKFFIKRIPLDNNVMSEFILSIGAFHKETAFYSLLVEQLRRYSVKWRFPWAPECYFTRPDILVMEDLLDKGFTLFDKLQFMDYNHCEVILQTIASFHASSIVLEEKKKELLTKVYKLNEIYPDLFVENMFVNSGNNQLKYWFHINCKSIKALLPHLPNYGIKSEFYSEVMEKVSGILDSVFDLLKPSTKYRNVLCHGDVWTNNMLFRYGNDMKTPEEVRFVDFQTYRYTPPAADVVWCLILTTSREFRKQHEEELLQVYYRNLSRELLRNGYVAEQLLPWEDFRESSRYYGITGRITAALTYPRAKLPRATFDKMVKTVNDQDILLKQDRDNEIVHTFNTNPEYRLVVSDALEELIECDIL